MWGITAAPGSRDAAELDRLCAPVGAPRSGYERYGAAMYFFKAGRISAELLEVYRKCCKFDGEDPVRVAAYEGLRG